MNRRELIKSAVVVSSFGVAPGLRSEVADPARTATAVRVIVDQAQALGPAEAIGDLIGSQYEPYTFGFRNRDQWGIQAWREIGFNISDIALFHFEGSNPNTVSGKIVGIRVARDVAGKLHLDFSDFDKNIDFMRKDLGVKKIDFTVWGTPKALADRAAGATFFFHAPGNYQEWGEIVRAAVKHIKDDLGLAGSSYKPWTEPDSGFYWRGRAHEGQTITNAENAEKLRQARIKDVRILDDYVDKYVNDWHAIKAVDPAAKVGGPFSVYSLKLEGSAFSLDDFLTKIGDYNKAHPASRVTVDELVYQDYNWHGNGLSEGVVGANALVKKHGLPSDTPLVVAGWNNGMKNDQSLQRRAAYLASNIISELVPRGRLRTLSRAYIWPFDYDYYAEGLAPVIMPYGAVTYTGDDGSDGPLTIPAVTEYRKRPAHAALRLLSRMKPGRLIRAHTNSTSLAVLASLQPDDKIMFVAANYSPLMYRIGATLANSGFSAREAQLTTQRVDATHSADGSGLEHGESRLIKVPAGGELPSFDVAPNSMVGVTISGVGG